MNLETLSSPGGDTGAACSLSSLLALGCRSRAEAAHSFAKKLQTKLWSLSPSQSTTDGLSTNPEENEEDASSWGVAVEARFDVNSKRVETVVTSVPLITSAFSNSNSNSAVYQPTGYQAFQVSQDPSPSEPAVAGSMEHKNANNRGSLEDGWSNYQKVHGGEQTSSSGARAHDQESDTSSTTTTNPMSDSDQYFDFGIETPIELDSAGEETNVSHEVPIVINRDDGLPVQPEGMESGCIFGSPTLSGEDSDDVDDREEEPSFYESLSQSPASAGFAQKANHDRFNFNHSCEPVSGPPDAVNVNVDLSGHNGDAQAPPPDSNAILDVENAPAQSSAPRAEFSRVVLGCSQGDLEDESDGFTGDESATGPLRAEITHFTSTVSHGSQASSPTAEIQPKKDYSLETEDVNQVSDVLTHLSTLNLDMVRLDPIIVVDQLFNGSANVSDSRATTLQLELEKDSSEQYIIRENVVEITNELSEIEASPEPEVEEESSHTSTSSEATSTKESTPSKEEDGVTDDEEDNQPNRHRVQRSTSLKSGKTPPGTPGRKKIVRFADALGLDLALVRTFLDEVPNVPQSAFNDLGDCTVEEDAALSRTAPPPAGSSYIRITRRDPSTNSSVTTFVNSPRILVASFTQPGSLPDFLERVKKQKVCLETACMMDESKLRGVVRCLNIDFHKSVLIRYTTDEWRTQNDQQATYVPDSCDGLSDRFTFILAGAQTMQPGQRLIFAICYRVAGQEIWDSNQSKNYVFQCISNSNYLPSIALSSPSVSDTFLPYM